MFLLLFIKDLFKSRLSRQTTSNLRKNVIFAKYTLFYCMRTIYTAVIFTLLYCLVASTEPVAAQKAHRLSGSSEHSTKSSNNPAHRLQEVVNNNEEPPTRNKAFSLDEEVEDEAYKSEVSFSIGAAIPGKSFALYTPEGSNVIQGAKIGTSIHANYSIWFIKYFGIGIDLNGGIFGYDFSKTPEYTPAANQRNVKTKHIGWSVISLGASLKTKFPVYKNSVFITGRIFAQYGMVNSPLSKATYEYSTIEMVDKEDGTQEEKTVWKKGSPVTLFSQDMSHNIILGGGVGARVKVMKRLYVIANFDYSYSTANNSKNKFENNRVNLFSKTYSAFTIEAGISYSF
jgi:hypothetical protein